MGSVYATRPYLCISPHQNRSVASLSTEWGGTEGGLRLTPLPCQRCRGKACLALQKRFALSLAPDFVRAFVVYHPSLLDGLLPYTSIL